MMSQMLILIVLLMLSAFFSAAETAFFAISKVKARHIAKNNRPVDRLIQRMKEDPRRLLSMVLIGRTLANTAAAALAAILALGMFPSYAVGIATGIMTLLILVFCEIIPKSVATHNPLFLARLVVFPIHWLSLLCSPLIWFLDCIPLLTGKIKKTPALTTEELKTFVEVVEEEGEIREEEREFIHNIIEFDDTNAYESMTPRGDMFVIDLDQPLDLKSVLQSGYTRFPVIQGGIDKVVGIINIKDIFMHQLISQDPLSIQKLMARPYFVPENKKLDSLLRQFKKRKQHMAIVVDEHGGIAGLITMEDVLEEIVGEINDESDVEEPHILPFTENEWIVLGKSEIEEVNGVLNMDIPESKEYDTFSGYVLDCTGSIPVLGEKIHMDGFEVTVRKIDGNRIQEYHVRKIVGPVPPEEVSPAP